MSSKKYSIYGGKSEGFYWNAVMDSSRSMFTEKYAVVHLYLCIRIVYGLSELFQIFFVQKGSFFCPRLLDEIHPSTQMRCPDQHRCSENNAVDGKGGESPPPHPGHEPGYGCVCHNKRHDKSDT